MAFGVLDPPNQSNLGKTLSVFYICLLHPHQCQSELTQIQGNQTIVEWSIRETAVQSTGRKQNPQSQGHNPTDLLLSPALSYNPVIQNINPSNGLVH